MAYKVLNYIRDAAFSLRDIMNTNGVELRLHSGTIQLATNYTSSTTSLATWTRTSGILWFNCPQDGNVAIDESESTLPMAALATGTASWFALYNTSTNKCLMTGTVSVTGGAGDLFVADVSIVQGQDAILTDFEFSLS